MQNDCFMEITEAFQQQSSSAKSPKNSTNCNGHSMQQGYCDGEISFIPLEERGISIKGKTIELYVHCTVDDSVGLLLIEGATAKVLLLYHLDTPTTRKRVFFSDSISVTIRGEKDSTSILFFFCLIHKRSFTENIRSALC